MRRLLIVLLVAVAVAACDKTNWEASLFRDIGKHPGSGYVVTDAKQRLVVNVPNSRSPVREAGAPNRIVCAEPSPDVAQALSEALKFSAAATVEGQGGGNLGLARSFSHSVAQLGERLAVIQLLRDKMYRACEAYANGAVQASGYTLLLARLDKTMVSLLSTEMIAGAFGRSLAQIGGGAGTGGVDEKQLEEAKQAVTLAAKKLKDAAAEPDATRADSVKKASKELDEANQNLFTLEMRTARTSAIGTVAMQALGQISGGATGTASNNVPTSIVNLHRNYLDDHGLEPVVDACIVAMDRGRLSVEDQKKILAAEQGLAKFAGDPPADQAKREKFDTDKAAARRAYEEATLFPGSPFATFCARTILTYTNHEHSFVRAFMTLKRDLRNAPGGSAPNDGDAPMDKSQVEREQMARNECQGWAIEIAKNGDKAKEAKRSFEEKSCARILG